jgi:tRNA1Val (adenine37-N6)-methyltransferase
LNQDTTTDTFFNGRLVVRQPKDGYRFSIDAVLLAHLACPRAQDRLIDIGAGCGIVALILATRFPGICIHAVEIQPALADLARENVLQNSLEDRIEVAQADLRRIRQQDTSGPFDMMVCNPPYRKTRSGRINPDPQKAMARHELAAGLQDVAAAAARLLKRTGRLALIYPAERTAELIAEMRLVSIEPKTLRMLHSRIDAEAKLVFVEGSLGGNPGLRVEPPLLIYAKQGNYSEEVERMLQGSYNG